MEFSLAKLLISGAIFKIPNFVNASVFNIGFFSPSKTRKSTLSMTLLLKDTFALKPPASFNGSLLR